MTPPFVLAASAVLLLLGICRAQQWQLTGKRLNDSPTTDTFRRTTVDLQSLFTEKADELANAILYFGGVVARYNGVLPALEQPTLDVLDSLHWDNREQSSWEVESALEYDLLHHRDYGREVNNVEKSDEEQSVSEAYPLTAIEIGLPRRGKFMEKRWVPLSLGSLLAVTVKESNTTGSPSRLHRILINIDMLGLQSVVMHTSFSGDFLSGDTAASPPTSSGVGDVDDSCENPSCDTEAPEKGASETRLHASPLQKIRVMTYNIWHTNPPSWLWSNRGSRWEKYETRMRHFADVVVREDPDIILFQEVRLDNTFRNDTLNKEMNKWREGDGHKFHAALQGQAGSQTEHVLTHLRQASKRYMDQEMKNDNYHHDMNFANYSYVYQPAMAMSDLRVLSKREEEGVAIFSKMPIEQAEVLLLSRRFGDKSDEHQRAALRVRVSVPMQDMKNDHHDSDVGSSSSLETPIRVAVDLFNTHLSLSPDARYKSISEILEYMNASSQAFEDNYENGECQIDGDKCLSSESTEPEYLLQILGGDFNAEPHESSYRLALCANDDLMGNENDDRICLKDSWVEGLTGGGGDAPFEDEDEDEDEDTMDIAGVAGMKTAMTPARKAKLMSRKVKKIQKLGYTFPASDPIKRIDFILFRDLVQRGIVKAKESCELKKFEMKVLSSRIVGTEPTPDTAGRQFARDGLGMLDKDSPVWASDHYALVTDFVIQTAPSAPSQPQCV